MLRCLDFSRLTGFISFLLLSQAVCFAQFDTIVVKDVHHHIQEAEKHLGHDINVALRHAQIARNLSILENAHRQYEANFVLGQVFFYKGMSDKAVEFWIRSLELAQTLENDALVAKMRFNISGAYIALDEFEKAYEYIRKSRLYFDSLEDKSPVVSIKLLTNEALILSNLKRFSKAKDVFQKAFELAAEHKLETDHQTLISAYTSYLLDIEDYDAAEQWILSFYDKYQANILQHLTNIYRLSFIYYHTQRIEAAREKSLKGLKLAKNQEVIEMMIRFSDLLQNIEKASNNLNQAFVFKELHDSILAEKKNIAALEKLLEYEFLEQYKAFEKELTTKYAQAAEATRYRYILASLIIFILFATFTYVYFNKKRIQAEKLSSEHEAEKQFMEEAFKSQMNQLTRESIRLLKRNTQLKDKLQRMPIEPNDELTAEVASKNQEPSKEIQSDLDVYFNKVDPSFYVRLLKLHPDLTPNERRLCALLHLDLNTKEIATLMRKSARAVEVSRGRLRKKIGLQTKSNINNYFRSI